MSTEEVNLRVEHYHSSGRTQMYQTDIFLGYLSKWLLYQKDPASDKGLMTEKKTKKYISLK